MYTIMTIENLIFVKQELKGVLKYRGKTLHPPPDHDRRYHGNVTECDRHY
jgi:hypothetical protein